MNPDLHAVCRRSPRGRLLKISFAAWMTCFSLFITKGWSQQTPDSLQKKIKVVQSNFSSPKKESKKIHKAFRQSVDTAGFNSARRYANERMASLGFAEFSLDSFARKNDSLNLFFHRGPQYFIHSIELKGLSEMELLRNDFAKMAKKNSPLSVPGLELKLASVLNSYEDEGYPFARFDSLQISYTKKGKDSLLAYLSWSFQPGDLIKIDTIIFEGKFRENQRFVQTLAGVHPGDVFNQSLIDNIPRSLNNSIYFKSAKLTGIKFSQNAATVTVKLEPKRAGRFDLLLGLLPPRENDTKIQFTGLIDLQLVSPFMRAGEVVQFRFDKLPGSSQKLHLQYQQPYIFGSPMKGEFEFNMQKQDTIFLNRWLRVTGYYAFNPSFSVKLWYRNKSSSLISTEAYENDSLTVPPVLDGKDQLWGAGFTFDNLDYRFNPTKGWVVKADFGIGSKKIIDNPRLHDNIYRGLSLRQPKREAEFELQYYHSFLKRWVILLANKTWWLSQEQFFQNDLLQVGGSRSIRGFNENEFYTDFYTFFTFENRFILEQNSWLFVFADYAYLQNQIASPKVIRPFGVGVGMVYETKAGMVSVSYAVGTTGNIPFQPARGRIHIGLINQF